MSESSVIVVEDEPDIGELIRFHLDREGFAARVIESARKGLDEIQRCRPDLVVLDLMLPDLDGLEICRRLKRDDRTCAIPILIVSAKGEETDIVTGLELGADDYVTKPFSPRVLMARARNVLRRGRPASTNGGHERGRIGVADAAIVIDLDRHSVAVDDTPVELTRTEFGILRYLAARPGFVRTRDQIISAVHGGTAVLTSRTIDVHVTAIRRKLGDRGAMIRTVRGVGYRLDETADLAIEHDGT